MYTKCYPNLNLQAQMTAEQIRKLKKQEYNKRYQARKKQEEFVKAIKTIQSNGHDVISNSEKAYLADGIKKLHTTLVILSIFIIILAILVLIK